MHFLNDQIKKILFTNFFFINILLVPISFFSTLGSDQFIAEDRGVSRPLGGTANRNSRNAWQSERGGYVNYSPRVYNDRNYYPYNYGYPYYDDVNPYPYFDYNYYDYYSRYPTLSYPLSTYLDSTSLYNSSRTNSFPTPRAPRVNPHQDYYYYPN